ncbi:hypothetical protein [Rhodobacter capsulatus]|uniref:hypothetical protein n=1 Tax=Rhodobacter capsulatus TaxID=1061 RepID=UPI004026587D
MAEASRSFDLTPSEIEGWVEDAKRGMENSLRANPLDIREQYEKQLKDLQEAYGEAMLELRARKKLAALMEREDGQLIRTLHEGLLADGIAVSIAKLCTWFGVPRRTVYYKPTKAAPKVEDRFAVPIKAMIEANPSFGYRTVAGCWGSTVRPRTPLVRVSGPNDGAADLPDQGLAGPQARHRHAAADRGGALGRHGAERALVDGSGAGLDRQGWLGVARPGDRLPQARTWAGTCHVRARPRPPAPRSSTP